MDKTKEESDSIIKWQKEAANRIIQNLKDSLELIYKCPAHALELVEEKCCEKCKKIEIVLRPLVKGGGYPGVSCCNSFCPCHSKAPTPEEKDWNNRESAYKEGKRAVLQELRSVVERKMKPKSYWSYPWWKADELAYNTALTDILSEIKRLEDTV